MRKMSAESGSQADLERTWVPRTSVGRLVAEGRIKSIDEILKRGIPIQEPEIVDMLVPGLKEEIIEVRRVQRQTDAGELTQLRIVAAVGDGISYVGVGKGKGREFRIALADAIRNAKLNIVKVRKGCGSWECGCGKPHSIPVTVTGSSGSVRVTLMPAPRKLGIVGNETAKVILSLGGLQDVRVFSKGQTKNRMNYAFAVHNALWKLLLMTLPQDWRT
ncbi:MAG TPA: 30S ribosomal protein S5 [Candidatus Korarchaeota archaeon]|nr:30S ribosomal protein S5 [Candidatus Korarchaeota archaeon]HDI73688.1 30S ribosomal protein S5 [Candidatus Korarchaeota archaeon]